MPIINAKGNENSRWKETQKKKQRKTGKNKGEQKL